MTTPIATSVRDNDNILCASESSRFSPYLLNPIKYLLSVLVLTLMSFSAQAAIIVESSYTDDIGEVSGTFSISYQIQNANTNVLVFGTYVDNASAVFDTLNFGDISGTNTAADAITYQDRVSLSYFLNPDLSAGLTINGTGSGLAAPSGYFVIELADIDTSVAVESTVGNGSIASITTSTNNRFILGIAGRNDEINNFNPDTGSGSVLTELLQDGNGGTAGIGYADAATADTYQLGWSPIGAGNDNYAEIAYAFATIPEPGTFTLTLAGLCVVALANTVKRRK